MRLIDADALKEHVTMEGLLGAGYSDTERERDVCNMIDDMPTIRVEMIASKPRKRKGGEERE